MMILGVGGGAELPALRIFLSTFEDQWFETRNQSLGTSARFAICSGLVDQGVQRNNG